MRYCQEKGIMCQYAGTNMHCRLSACILPKESLYPTASDYEHKAATALSTLQAENEKLRAELKKAEMELDSLLAEGETVAFDPFGAEKED